MAAADCEHPMCSYATHHELVAGTLPYEILHNNTQIMRKLTASGDLLAVAKERDHFGATALAVAAYVGTAEMLQLMLQAEGLNDAFTITDEEGHTPLSIAAARNHASVLRVAANAGVDVSAVDANDVPPLQYAVVGSCDQAIATLIVGPSFFKSARPPNIRLSHFLLS